MGPGPIFPIYFVRFKVTQQFIGRYHVITMIKMSYRVPARALASIGAQTEISLLTAVLIQHAQLQSPNYEHQAKWSSERFLIVLLNLLMFLIFARYGIWQDSAAWRILLGDVLVICL